MIGGPTVKLNIFSCLSSFSPFFAALFYNRLILLNYLKNDRATNLQSCIAFEASGDLDQCLGKERIRPVGAAPPPRIRPGANLLQVKPTPPANRIRRSGFSREGLCSGARIAAKAAPTTGHISAAKGESSGRSGAPPRIRPEADLLQVKPPRRPIVSVGAAPPPRIRPGANLQQVKPTPSANRIRRSGFSREG